MIARFFGIIQMSSLSFYEQLTSSVSLSMMGLVAVGTLAVILVYTVASRLFSSSSTKAQSNSSSKQSSNKDKKTKETNTKKQQQQPQAETTTSSNKKKNSNKAKTSATTTPAPAPAKTVVSSSSPSSQSEESEDEKVALGAPSKKPATSNKASVGKKVPVNDENKKSTAAANGAQASPTKQQQASVRNGNLVEAQSGDAKKKSSKPAAASAPSKQTATGKDDATNKVNTTASNKNQTAVVSSQATRPSANDEAGSDQEDDGQWVTQGSAKQVNNRNRNKGKPEVTSSKNQDSSSTAPSNRKGASEKRTAPAASANTNSSVSNQNDSDLETPVTSNAATAAVPTPQPVQLQEPIEICQLLPTSENRYTANDNWWKQALNKQPTFTVNDIGEWPEREEDEQYVVNVKRIVPGKSTTNNTKTALSEKDINVDGNDEINNYKNGKEDEKLNFDEQINTGESTTTASQTKKKSTNVRRLS